MTSHQDHSRPLIAITILYKDVSEKSASLYMQQRVEGERLKGKLEFPGGKIESDETPIKAAIREWREECSFELEANNLKLFKIYDVHGEYGPVRLFVFIGEWIGESASKSVQKNWYKLYKDAPLKGIEGEIILANKEIITSVISYLTSNFNTL